MIRVTFIIVELKTQIQCSQMLKINVYLKYRTNINEILNAGSKYTLPTIYIYHVQISSIKKKKEEEVPTSSMI